MPKILQIFKQRKRRKGRLRRALGLRSKTAPTNIIEFPQVTSEFREEYPDYEVISRWLKLADEMLGNPDDSQMDGYDDGNSRKNA